MKQIRTSLLLVIVALTSLIASSFAGTLVADGGQWKVRQVNSNLAVNTLDKAEKLLGGLNATSEAGVAVDQVDFGTDGNFAVDQTFPNLINGTTNFAIGATGTIDVTTAGDITFGILADDLASITIDGTLVVESTVVNEDAFGTIALTAGEHSVEVVFAQGAGTGLLEIFVAQTTGTYTAIDDATFELLDVVSDQSPTAISPTTASYQTGAPMGAVLANLSASGGAGGDNSYRIVVPLNPAATDVVAVPEGDDWNALDDGTQPPADWNTVAFDDSAWPKQAQPAPLGYGDNDDWVQTTIDWIDTDPDTAGNQKNPTTYFRNKFTIGAGEAALVDVLRLRLNRDDGAVVYINGNEVVRSAMPDGAIDKDTLANIVAGGAMERTFFDYQIDPALANLVDGENVIAVEVHQTNLTSSDVTFELSLNYDLRQSPVVDDGQYFATAGNQLVLAQSSILMPTRIFPFNVTVRATNAYGASFDQVIAVSKAAAGTASPTAVAVTPATVEEGLPAGTVIGTLSATDADASDLHSFQLINPTFFPDNNAFTVSGNMLLSAMPFDVATQASYTINVQATDQGGNALARFLPITVTAAAPGPSLISLTPDTLPLNAPEFTKVGTLSTDDFGTSHTYSMTYPVNPTPEQLISFGDDWKFLDNGSDQGTAWTASGFDDNEWVSAASPLGYGQKNEPDVEGVAVDPIDPTTLVSFGDDADNKYATTYFRSTFEIADPRLVESMRFEMELDDGGLVYVNGNLWFRVRAADVDSYDDYTGQGDGTETTNDVINFTTAAVVDVTGSFADLLVAGTNTIAIEVHQTNATSSDLWLNLDLQATVRDTAADNSDMFYISDGMIFINREVGDFDPAASVGATYTFGVESTSNLGEVRTGDLTVTIGAETFDAPTDIALDNTSVDEVQGQGEVVGTLSTTDVNGGAFVYSLDPDPTYPDNALFTADGDQLVTTVALDWDLATTHTIFVTTTDNTGRTYSKEFTITVNEVSQTPTAITLVPDSFGADAPVDTVVGTLDAVDGNATDTHTFTFGTFPDVPPLPILPFGSEWKYLDDGSNQTTAWTAAAPGFDDSLWASGPAELGYGDNDEATEVSFGPDEDNKHITTYFRHTLNVPTAATNYEFNVRFDDAAVVYINGAEVWRSDNLPVAPEVVAFDTLATAQGTENGLSGQIALDPGTIVDGDNIIAVEIHQFTVTSSDISFDLELKSVDLVPSPYGPFFAIDGDQLKTAVDFSTTAYTAPFTFDIPIIAEDADGNTVESVVAVNMATDGGDTDNDGLPDDWERDNFEGSLAFGPNDDNDADGDTNAEELEAGTDPTNPNDSLRISRIEFTGADVQVTWPAKVGHTYSVYWSPDLAAGNWTMLEGGLTVAADGDLMSIDTAPPAPGERTYRVEAARTAAP